MQNAPPHARDCPSRRRLHTRVPRPHVALSHPSSSVTRIIEPFPFDASMPELRRAADGAAMGRLFRHHVRGAWRPHVAIEECRVTRIRYRRHARCVLQYELALGDRGIARRAWVTGTVYADPRRAARHARGSPHADFIPELRMVVKVFPIDHRLPHAAAIVTVADPQLREAVVRACGGTGWQVDSWVSEPVRYSERLSLVVRYTVRASNTRTGETAERVFYVKCYADRDVARQMFANADALAGYCTRSATGVHIQAPVACLDHLQAVLAEATPGRSLADIIARDNRCEASAAAREAARALVRFNVSDAPVRREYRARHYAQSLAGAAQTLEWACPELTADLYSVVSAVSRGAVDHELGPTHRDIKPQHVLLGAGQPALIDLDSCVAADPVRDAAHMLAHFEALAGAPGAAPHVEEVGCAFADEYFRSAPAPWRRRLSLYYAGSLLEVAAALFDRQEAGWRERIVPLVRAATRIIRPGLILRFT